MFDLRLCVLLCLVANAICDEADLAKAEEDCFKLYRNGKELNFEQLAGDWHPVYNWPENPATECATITFKEIQRADMPNCKDMVPEDAKVVAGSYSFYPSGQVRTRYYFGSGDVKQFVYDYGGSCQKMKVMFTEQGDGHILGVTCPNHKNVLMARNVPKAADLSNFVKGISVLQSRSGGSVCV